MITNCKCDYCVNSPLERGRVGMCGGGGVFAGMLANTPLHPSHPDSYWEGSRTALALKSTSFLIFNH